MDEKLKKALECCSRVNCCACPKLKDVNCMQNLYAETKRYIDDLEERISIMQESMETLEQRCKALEKRNEPKTVEIDREMDSGLHLAHCPNCWKFINSDFHYKYCGYCGQAVTWND